MCTSFLTVPATWVLCVHTKRLVPALILKLVILRFYSNNIRVFLSRIYRLIVAPRKFDVLKTTIIRLRSELSRATMLVVNIKISKGQLSDKLQQVTLLLRTLLIWKITEWINNTGYTLTTLWNSNLWLKTDVRVRNVPYNDFWSWVTLESSLQDWLCLVLKTKSRTTGTWLRHMIIIYVRAIQPDS